MDILRQVRMKYGLSDLKWIKENETFRSEYGSKRVRFWKDKQLLEWHVKWRDEISKQSGVLLDRMIRTEDGNPFFYCDKGWVTIHDEIEEPFPLARKEEDWGRLIGTILAVGLKQLDECHRLKKRKDLTLKAVHGGLKNDHDPMAKLVLERSYFEAKSRVRKAHILRDRIHPIKLPILTSLTRLTNAKQVFFHLFWVCGADEPVRSYKPIRNLLEEWFEKNGEASTIKLLNEINRYFTLKGDQGRLLLSECLLPYEYESAINELSTCNQSVDITTTVMDKFFQRWETSRNVVLLLSNWMEEDREKVVAK